MTLHSGKGWLGWENSPCSKMACHTSCGITCSANQLKLAWPYFSGCFVGHTWEASEGCTPWPASRKAKNDGGCPIIFVNACRHSNTWFATNLIGGGRPSYCQHSTTNCVPTKGHHPYFGEANHALMASLGVTTSGSNVLATFSWSS